MTHILLIALWTVFLSSWYSSWYFFRAGQKGVQPDMSIVFKMAIVSIVALALGCLMYSFLQASIISARYMY